MALVFCIGLLILHFCLPIPLMFVTFLINLCVPDPIPVIDELLMILGILEKLNTLDAIFEIVGKIVDTLGTIFWILVVIILGAIIYNCIF